MPRMGKTEEDWNGLKWGFLKTVQPKSFSKFISADHNHSVSPVNPCILYKVSYPFALKSVALIYLYVRLVTFSFVLIKNLLLLKLKQIEILKCR